MDAPKDYAVEEGQTGTPVWPSWMIPTLIGCILLGLVSLIVCAIRMFATVCAG